MTSATPGAAVPSIVSASPTPSPAPATRLGRYVIAGRIAAGGMATVYLARLEAVGGFAREFALKVIHPHLADQPGFRERFQREARLASRVRHPNVVTTIDAGEDNGYCFMALELIEGGTLRQLALLRGRGFPAPESAQIVSEVARGLHALHNATDEIGAPLNVVHRDLSPHNVMLDRTGRAVLIDLGLAKADNNPALTQVGMLAGRLPYMSPEQSRQDPVDARSDVFSLGAVLFELVCDLPPFGDRHDTETMERLQRGDLSAAAQQLSARGVPQWLSDIILICLQPAPGERFPSAEALADALAQELDHRGHRTPETRQRLAGIVEGALPELGTLAAMHALPRRIERDPSQAMHVMTGPHPVVTLQPSRRRVPPVAWALSGAVAGALTLGAVLLLGNFAAEATPTVRHTPTSLSPDTAPRESPEEAAQGEPPALPTEPVVRSKALDMDPSMDLRMDLEALDTGTGDAGLAADDAMHDAGDDPTVTRRRRRVRDPKNNVAGLKPNPYREP